MTDFTTIWIVGLTYSLIAFLSVIAAIFGGKRARTDSPRRSSSKNPRSRSVKNDGNGEFACGHDVCNVCFGARGARRAGRRHISQPTCAAASFLGQRLPLPIAAHLTLEISIIRQESERLTMRIALGRMNDRSPCTLQVRMRAHRSATSVSNYGGNRRNISSF